MRQDREVEILLVEDNPADARLTMEAFKSSTLPHSLSHAQDGVEALEFLRRQGRFSQAKRPDLILLDLNLPRKDGRVVLADFKADPSLRSVPVVIFSTSQSRQDIARCYAIGANCYVSKPGNLGDFRAAVQAIEQFWFNVASLPD